LGALTTKSLTPEPREGNAPWRLIETRGGMLNAIGLANPGIDAFVRDHAPRAGGVACRVIGSVAGHSVDEFVQVSGKLVAAGLQAIELNVSCPNTADGRHFGSDPASLAPLVKAVRAATAGRALFVKLPPDGDTLRLAAAAIESGADAVIVCGGDAGLNDFIVRPEIGSFEDLRGKLLGLVGFGRIAQATAHRALHGFGMRIAYFSRRRADADIESALQAQHYASLDDLLQHSDVISLHIPGGADTHHLLDARRLALLKPSALLINTARGTVIDEAALADVLARSAIGGAGLDVYEREPVVHPGLLALDNVVLLPHQGTSTLETRTAMGLRVGTNLDAFFAGWPLPDPVV
jgi:hypothetical protein